MSATTEGEPVVWEQRALSLERGWLLTAAIVSVLIGLFVLFRPQAGVLTIAITFGLYLVFAGVSRFAFAVTRNDWPAGRRWLGGILGVIVVAAGFYCLLNLGSSLTVLGFTLGIGLILVGGADLANSDADRESRPTWMRVTSGILAIVAGLIMLILPFLSVGLIVWIGAIALIALGLVAMIALPHATES